MNWVRARSDEQIEQRINEILEATARLYEENRFEEITFVMIADEAGFTRSNLYRYFQTKEDIFLELMKQDIAIWRADALESFADGNFSLREVAEVSVDLILKHKRMVKLFDEARRELKGRLLVEGDTHHHAGSEGYHVHGVDTPPHDHSHG